MLITPKEAAEKLRSGAVIAYPTEAVYGLGCDPFNDQAVNVLLRIKQRESTKGLILVAESWQQVTDLVKPLSYDILEKVFATWPGPATWVFPASNKVPAWICGEHKTVAIRISAHRTVRELCKSFGGPIISTSANLSGFPPPHTRKELLKQFVIAQNPVKFSHERLIKTLKVKLQQSESLESEVKKHKAIDSSLIFLVCGRVGRLKRPTPIYEAISGAILRK